MLIILWIVTRPNTWYKICIILLFWYLQMYNAGYFDRFQVATWQTVLFHTLGHCSQFCCCIYCCCCYCWCLMLFFAGSALLLFYCFNIHRARFFCPLQHNFHTLIHNYGVNIVNMRDYVARKIIYLRAEWKRHSHTIKRRKKKKHTHKPKTKQMLWSSYLN